MYFDEINFNTIGVIYPRVLIKFKIKFEIKLSNKEL